MTQFTIDLCAHDDELTAMHACAAVLAIAGVTITCVDCIVVGHTFEDAHDAQLLNALRICREIMFFAFKTETEAGHDWGDFSVNVFTAAGLICIPE